MQPFGEASVEGGVVGQDDHGRGHECPHGIDVQLVAGDRVSADARQRGDLLGDGLGGLMVALEGVHHAQHLAFGAVGEAHHGELDHLIAPHVHPGRLHIDHQTQPAIGRRGGQGSARRQLAHHAVLAARLELIGHGLQRLASEHLHHPVCTRSPPNRR